MDETSKFGEARWFNIFKVDYGIQNYDYKHEEKDEMEVSLHPDDERPGNRYGVTMMMIIPTFMLRTERNEGDAEIISPVEEIDEKRGSWKIKHVGITVDTNVDVGDKFISQADDIVMWEKYYMTCRIPAEIATTDASTGLHIFASTIWAQMQFQKTEFIAIFGGWSETYTKFGSFIIRLMRKEGGNHILFRSIKKLRSLRRAIMNSWVSTLDLFDNNTESFKFASAVILDPKSAFQMLFDIESKNIDDEKKGSVRIKYFIQPFVNTIMGFDVLQNVGDSESDDENIDGENFESYEHGYDPDEYREWRLNTEQADMEAVQDSAIPEIEDQSGVVFTMDYNYFQNIPDLYPKLTDYIIDGFKRSKKPTPFHSKRYIIEQGVNQEVIDEVEGNLEKMTRSNHAILTMNDFFDEGEQEDAQNDNQPWEDLVDRENQQQDVDIDNYFLDYIDDFGLGCSSAANSTIARSYISHLKSTRRVTVFTSPGLPKVNCFMDILDQMNPKLEVCEKYYELSHGLLSKLQIRKLCVELGIQAHFYKIVIGWTEGSQHTYKVVKNDVYGTHGDQYYFVEYGVNETHVFGVKTHNLNLLTNKASCAKCGKWTQVYSMRHKCNSKIFKGKTMKKMTESDDASKIFDNVWISDMECFPDEKTGVHTPYMIVLKAVKSDKYLSFSGRSALRDFVKCLKEDDNIQGTIWFHNGSGYDFNFLLKGLLEYSTEEIEIIKRGNRILTFTIKEKPKLAVRDMFLFLPSSLEKLSKDFKLDDKGKGSFDHKKIKSWLDVKKHLKEAEKYCLQDVIATQEIYTKFSKAMYQVCPLNIVRTISLASHAMLCWRKIEDMETVEDLFVPSREMDSIFREAYFGGRSGPVYAKWDSEFYKYLDESYFQPNGYLKNDYISGNFLNDDDALTLIDIVSQYPAAMKHNKYPCGKPIKKDFDDKYGTDLAELIMESIYFRRNGWKELKSKMFRTVYCVDVDPPKDIYIAYLMERDEKKKNRQNLNRKCKKWYTGIDLHEAIKIGYTITKVHAQISFPDSKYVFTKYVSLLFKIKEENKHDKSSTLYIVAKLLMNSLYGKFAQKIHGVYTSVMSKLPKNPDEKWKGLDQFEIETIFKSENLKRLGYMVKAEKDSTDIKVTYPCYISMCVVAYARRDMSKKVRSINGYRNRDNCYLYTDTDSILVRKSAFKSIPPKYIGNQLGQFENEFPTAKIISYRSLAPKTYCLCLIIPKKDGYTLAYKVRCKGIPHVGTLIENTSTVETKSKKEIFKILKNPNDDVKMRYYVLHKLSEENLKKNGQIVPFLDIEVYDKCLTQDYTVTCFFGTMVKNKKTSNKKDTFSIRCDWALRRLVMQNYWTKSESDRVITSWSSISECKGSFFDSTSFNNQVEDFQM